jgi:hypothetical protein
VRIQKVSIAVLAGTMLATVRIGRGLGHHIPGIAGLLSAKSWGKFTTI